MKDISKKVKLVITSVSKNDGKDVVMIDGLYSGRGNLHTVEYAESGEDLSGTTTRLLFLSDHASIVRKGALNSKMEFYPDTVKSSYYETQFGSIYMEIETTHVSFTETPTGFCGRITYRLFFGGDKNNFDHRDMRIQVTFCE